MAGFAGDEVADGFEEGGGWSEPGPERVGADHVDEGVEGVILEGQGEEKPAGGVGFDGYKEGLAVL